MSTDDRSKLRPSKLPPPPRLERVPDTGYTPPPIRGGTTPVPHPGSSAQAVHLSADSAIRAGLRYRGDLAIDSSLRLFSVAAAQKSSGRLRLLGAETELSIAFCRGVPGDARSTDPADSLVRFLLDRGALHPGVLIHPDGDSEYDLVASLLSKRDPAQVGRLVREHGARTVRRALQMERGTWEWEPQAHPGTLACTLGNAISMVSQAVRSMDATTVRRRLGERCRHRAKPVGTAIRTEELGLTPEEAAAAQLLDGTSSPLEIATFSPIDATIVLRTALLLFDTGVLSPEPITLEHPDRAP